MAITLNGDTGISGVDGTASAPTLVGNDSDTGVYFSAANTLDFATSGTRRASINSTGDLQFNSGYGSVATAYGCRAWVNFNGTGTVAIRGSGNVSSITDNGVGNYTVNFTSSMPDGTYSTVGSAKTSNNSTAGGNNNSFAPYTFNTGAVSMLSIDAGSGAVKDSEVMTVAVFR